ncbi:MAG: hypothetical protein L0213_11845 [Candidatus Dadabacteria bacterium]|nr:hypothetical protein [Candidatus Dadabacteria bacterium]
MPGYRVWVFVIIIVACFAVSIEEAFASDGVLLAEIRTLRDKVAEIDQLKMQIADLQRQVASTAQRCEALEIHGTVAEIKESLIKYKPGEGVEISPCGF